MPIAALVERPHTEADLQALAVRLRKDIAEGDYPYTLNDDNEELSAQAMVKGNPLGQSHP